jgi:SOS-response transcriptional repressor LexA
MTAPVLTDMLKETIDMTTFRKTQRTIQNKMHQPGTKDVKKRGKILRQQSDCRPVH